MRRGNENQLMEDKSNHRNGGKRKMMEEHVEEQQHEQGGDGLPPFKVLMSRDDFQRIQC